jgi:predicted ATPase
LIENRLECGFYIFDEPEAALSYQNQLRFLLWMHRAVKSGSQLIVSTHSPVLLAYPGAVIYHLNAEGITETSFEDSYIYNDMRSFVNNVSLVQKELGLLDCKKS